MSGPGQQRFAAAWFAAAAVRLVAHRRACFAGLVVLTLLLAVLAGPMRLDNSLEIWFLEDDPALAAFNEFKARYGSDFEGILALVDCREGGVFSLDRLNDLWRVSKAIEGDKTLFRRVVSVGLAPCVELTGNTLVIQDSMNAAIGTASEAAAVKTRILDDPSKKKMLLDPTGSHAMILIEPQVSTEIDQRRPRIIREVRRHLEGLPYRLAGMGVMHEELNAVSLRDGTLFTAVGYLTISLMILAIYRSWTMVLMSVGSMLFSGIGFVAVYGLLGQSFNLVTIVLPTLIMILSLSDVAYVYNCYCFNIDRVIEDREKGLIHVFEEALSPCLFTSLTNFAGFIGVVASPMAVLRTFGLFAAFATIAEYVVAMIVCVFVLGYVTPRPEARDVPRPFAGLVRSCVALVPRYHRLIMIMAVVMVGLSVFGISRLEIDTFSMGFLPVSNPIRVDSDAIESVYGNYLPLEIRLLTGKKDGIKEPAFLRLLDRAHTELEALPNVQKASSVLDVLKKLNQVMNSGRPEDFRVPDSFSAASQLLMMYESDPKSDLEYLTDLPHFTEARLTLRVPMVSAARLSEIETGVHRVLHGIFDGTGIELRFGGYIPLYSRVINYITQSQVQSFAFAFVNVFGAIAIFLRRLDAMLLTLLPNLLPLTLTMGTMGILGIPLDNATVTIAAIAMGIVVDDTIHEMYLFCDPSRAHLDPVESISDSLNEAGSAVVSTSLIYGIGFLVFAFASIRSVIYFGTLLSLSIGIALVCEITVLPAQICLFRRFWKKPPEAVSVPEAR